MPIIILAGDEELFISEKLEALKERLLDPSWASFNYSQQSQPDLKQVADAAAALPFGPGNKVIVFQNCDLFTKKRAGKSEEEPPAKGKGMSDKANEQLDGVLANIAERTYLIFCCPFNFDKSLKISKTFEKYAEIEACQKIKFYAGGDNAEMRNWCRKRAHKYGAIIDDEAGEYLAESADGDLRLIAGEIEKASIFVLPDNKITLDVVSDLCPHYSRIFALLDHWLQHERGLVVTGIQEVISRQPAIALISMIQTSLTKWINLKAACERVTASLPGGRGIQRRELPPAEMAKRLQSEIKINPWVLKMDLERIQKVSLFFLVHKKKELTRLELSVKTGMMTDVHALTIFFTGD